MIVADRRELETSIRQRALQIQLEELRVFVDNMQTLGTQSAFLAGLGWSAITLDYESQEEYAEWAELCLYTTGVAAVGMNVLCAFVCAFTSIHAPALAIRGPDGSMAKALAGMYAQRKLCLRLFGFGLLCILANGVFVVKARTRLPATLSAGSIVLIFGSVLAYKASELTQLFKLPVEYRRVNEHAGMHRFAAASQAGSADGTRGAVGMSVSDPHQLLSSIPPGSIADAPAARYASMLRRGAPPSAAEALAEPLCGDGGLGGGTGGGCGGSAGPPGSSQRGVSPVGGPTQASPLHTTTSVGGASGGGGGGGGGGAAEGAPPSISGALRKRGGKVQTYWKLRYFSLNCDSAQLQYYALEGEPAWSKWPSW